MAASGVWEWNEELSDKERYEKAIKEYKVKEEDAQVKPGESVEFYIPGGTPLSWLEWRIPYEKVEKAIKEITEKRENYSPLTRILIEIARDDQKAERERWEWAQQLDVLEYDVRKELYENLREIDEVRGEITEEGNWQLGFAVCNEQELSDAILELLQSKNSK